MTAPTITDDFMFDLDLQIVPVEEGRGTSLSPNLATGSIFPCTSGCRPATGHGNCGVTNACPTYYTCRRCQ
ncbi:hypothetical protein [Virgisporangium aurantiacum]|uniref:Uncharacterized protein n=1 Tax=Virgisporangium aurantiacum TaxID=175570 RepID=A0A8J4E2P3_9ACTN|nr:hypothetical protein [Virgisporangium aurantiacum]GIJ60070.1 hypothetical protein Vau01_075860 [Virgisporangium aurantiacum]